MLKQANNYKMLYVDRVDEKRLVKIEKKQNKFINYLNRQFVDCSSTYDGMISAVTHQADEFGMRLTKLEDVVEILRGFMSKSNQDRDKLKK